MNVRFDWHGLRNSLVRVSFEGAMGEIELPDVARLVALDVGTHRRSAVRAARAELDALITSVKPR